MKNIDLFIGGLYLMDVGGVGAASGTSFEPKKLDETDEPTLAEDINPAEEPNRNKGASNELTGRGVSGNGTQTEAATTSTTNSNDSTKAFSELGAKQPETKGLLQSFKDGYDVDPSGKVFQGAEAYQGKAEDLPKEVREAAAAITSKSSEATAKERDTVETSKTMTVPDFDKFPNAADVPKIKTADGEELQYQGKVSKYQGAKDGKFAGKTGEGIFGVCEGANCPKGSPYSDLTETQKLAVDNYAADKGFTKEIADPKTVKSTEAADNDVAIAQPKENVDLTRALKLTSEDGKATVVRRGDGVEGDQNHDNAEARSHLLDGQLDSDKNTFSTFEKDGEKYLGFYSEGYGEGDERSGIVKLSELDGKNLGADGWSAASDAEKAMLGSAHKARKEEIAKFGGVDGYNQAEKARETIARLQAHSTQKDADGKYSLNGEGANADQIDSLNNIMGRLNNNAEPLEGIQKDLNALLKENSSVEGKTLEDNVLDQRISELDGKGFSPDEITKLKEDGISHSELDAEIDTKRNEAHKLSPEETTKFNETIADLKTRENLSPQQKQMLDRLEAMAKDGGLEKMGKYLQTELGNLAANAPKPEPKPQEGTRGGEAIDFGSDSFKGFKESIGDDVLKQTFGEKYTEDVDNLALKQAIEEFDALKGDEKSIEAFKDVLSKGKLDLESDSFKSLVEAAKKDNTEFNDNAKKIQEAGLKIEEAKDDTAKTEAEDLKAKLEARQTEIQALKDARKSFSQASKQYDKLPDGTAYKKLDENKVTLLKSGETGIIEGEDDKAKFKADPKEEVKPQDEVQDPDVKNNSTNNTLSRLGLPKEGGVFDFSAAWCGPCQQMEPDVEKLEREGLPIKHSMNADENGLAQDFKVSSFPTLIKFDSNGNEVARVEGKQSENKLRAFVG